MKMLNTPADWIGQIHFTGLPLLSSEELKEAQKSLMKAYVDTQHILDQPGKNHDGYGYKYADLNDVISSIQAATKDLDIAYIQQPVTQAAYSIEKLSIRENHQYRHTCGTATCHPPPSSTPF